MKIQEKDLFHGAALTQIVEHKSLKALNVASPKYGHYLVNTDREVFVKYRKSARAPFIFTFQPEEVRALYDALTTVPLPGQVILCLVCGQTTVCALSSMEFSRVLDLSNPPVQQSVRVDIPSGGSCHVSGTKGQLKRAVTHNSFPDKVFT